MRKPSMFTALRTWPARRPMITAGVAAGAFAGLVLASGLVGVPDGSAGCVPAHGGPSPSSPWDPS